MNVGFPVFEPERTLFAVLISLISPPDSTLGGLWTLSSTRDWEITLYLQLRLHLLLTRLNSQGGELPFWEIYLCVSCYPALLLKVQVILLIPANCYVYVRLPFSSPWTQIRQFAQSREIIIPPLFFLPFFQGHVLFGTSLLGLMCVSSSLWRLLRKEK